MLAVGLLDHVTVLIGICVGGKAVGGVMYQPYYNYQAGPDAKLGRAIWGIIGMGMYSLQDFCNIYCFGTYTSVISPHV